MEIDLKYKNESQVLRIVKGEVPYLEYPMLAETGVVKHGFSTRLGGVSEGCYASMNLSFTRGRQRGVCQRKLSQNRRGNRSTVRGYTAFSQQTHTTNVRTVTEEDRGMGMMRPLEYTDVDGLVTNIPGICLVTFLCGLCSLVFCGSCETCDRSEPFRVARNGRKDRKGNNRTDVPGIWLRCEKYSGGGWTVDLSGLL